MSFHRGNKKSNSRSNSPLSNNSPSLSHATQSDSTRHHPNAGLRSQSQAVTAAPSNPTTSSTLSLTEKDFVEKGKENLNTGCISEYCMVRVNK